MNNISEELKLCRPLLDDEGENQAVKVFLLLYGGTNGITVGGMVGHLTRSGFAGCWPNWVCTINNGEHLTKAGAQMWLRHLFSLEGYRDAVPEGYIVAPKEPTQDMLDAARYSRDCPVSGSEDSGDIYKAMIVEWEKRNNEQCD